MGKSTSSDSSHAILSPCSFSQQHPVSGVTGPVTGGVLSSTVVLLRLAVGSGGMGDGALLALRARTPFAPDRLLCYSALLLRRCYLILPQKWAKCVRLTLLRHAWSADATTSPALRGGRPPSWRRWLAHTKCVGGERALQFVPSVCACRTCLFVGEHQKSHILQG